MTQYIDKSALVAEIKRLLAFYLKEIEDNKEDPWAMDIAKRDILQEILSFLDTLEVKEVEEKFECPNIKIKDAIEVSSRMKYIDEDLKPIADFIMDYASWNLHKDEWNQPVLEVPLFRVLDALAQRGKPYCCAD